jgi:hypothetical protein
MKVRQRSKASARASLFPLESSECPSRACAISATCTRACSVSFLWQPRLSEVAAEDGPTYCPFAPFLFFPRSRSGWGGGSRRPCRSGAAHPHRRALGGGADVAAVDDQALLLTALQLQGEFGDGGTGGRELHAGADDADVLLGERDGVRHGDPRRSPPARGAAVGAGGAALVVGPLPASPCRCRGRGHQRPAAP